jgi:hypothetical protein
MLCVFLMIIKFLFTLFSQPGDNCLSSLFDFFGCCKTMMKYEEHQGPLWLNLGSDAVVELATSAWRCQLRPCTSESRRRSERLHH